MCRILGIVKYNNEFVSNEFLLSSLETSKTENKEVYMMRNVGFASTKVNTKNDADSTKKTLIDNSSRYAIVLNGELYNRFELIDELKSKGCTCQTYTDEDIILNGYCTWGDKVLDRLNGIFALAIYDREKHTLFIARDRFGVKSLYYSITKDGFIFANEIPVLLSVMSDKPSANENAIFEYLVFNRTDQTEQTFFNDIYKLQHGCCMTLDCSRTYTKDILPIVKWYDIKKRVLGKGVKKDNNEFMRLFTHAIQIRLSNDIPWGVSLSGGMDSSAITATIIRVLNEPNVHSFSAVYGKKCSADESNYIDCFKDLVPNMHYVYPDSDTLFANLENYVRILAEPTPTTSPFANYCVMQEAQKYVKITLDGQGADEALSGYEYIPGLYYKTLLTHFKWITLVKELVHYTKLHKSMRHIKYMIFFLLPARWRTKVRVNQRGYMDATFVARHQDSVIADKLYGANTMQEMLIRHFEYKLEHLLKWGERTADAFSMLSHQPFLDKDLVEYSLMLEDSAKVHNGYTKNILRDVMKGIMPEAVRTRVDKKGYTVPQDEWFRTPKFQTLVMDILLSDSFATRGFIIPDEAIKLYKKHLAGEVNMSKDIWKWINLELWFREFID